MLPDVQMLPLQMQGHEEKGRLRQLPVGTDLLPGQPSRDSVRKGPVMAKQSEGQKQIVERVMREYKHGELKIRGKKVTSMRQAIAIGLREAGASKYDSAEENRRNYRRTRQKEHGRTEKGQKKRA